MQLKSEDAVRALIRVGECVRDHVRKELRQQSTEALSTIAFETAADKIYAIDASVERVLLPALVNELQPILSFVLICEGVNDDQPLAYPARTPLDQCQARLIIDPIDGTRSIMYNKRSAWWLAGLAPNRGDRTSLQDIEVAVQIEIPTTRAAVADSLWAIRGNGAHGETVDLFTGERTRFRPHPSNAPTISGGYVSVFSPFPGGKEIFAQIEEELAREIIGDLEQSKTAMFNEQYLTTGGQLYELMIGRDRLLVDIRGLLYEKFHREAKPVGHACHPYDVATTLIAEEAGVKITDGQGRPLDTPLDCISDISWIGYANQMIRDEVEPVLRRSLVRHGLIL